MLFYIIIYIFISYIKYLKEVLQDKQTVFFCGIALQLKISWVDKNIPNKLNRERGGGAKVQTYVKQFLYVNKLGLSHAKLNIALASYTLA